MADVMCSLPFSVTSKLLCQLLLKITSLKFKRCMVFHFPVNSKQCTDRQTDRQTECNA